MYNIDIYDFDFLPAVIVVMKFSLAKNSVNILLGKKTKQSFNSGTGKLYPELHNV
jgi:hypothetical protein